MFHIRPTIIIAGTSELTKLAREILQALSLPKWMDVEIAEHLIEDLVTSESAVQTKFRNKYAQATIIISGEQSAAIFEKLLNKSVIPVKINEGDVLAELLKSNKNDVAVINYKTKLKNIDIIERQLGYHFRQYEIHDSDKFQSICNKLKSHGVRKIIGGSYACEVANALDMDTFMFYSKSALTDAINDSIRYLDIYRNEMEQAAMFQTVTRINKSGILSLNLDNHITTVNPSAEKLLDLKKENILNKHIDKILYDLTISIDQPLLFDWGEKKLTVFKSTITVNQKSLGSIVVIDDVKDIEKKELRIRERINQKSLQTRYQLSDIKGSSNIINSTKKMAQKISVSSSSVLIYGESGTGKELFAQSIHNMSNRSQGPFVAFNCAALPEHLLDSELFGYEEGAFTGANKKGKKGLFELADKGTIFLDEISELPLHLQSKLLRVLQEKEIMKIGGKQIIPIDVRIVAATNTDLMKSIKARIFREDLYYRINTLHLTVPPLRERKGDIEDIIIDHFKNQDVDIDEIFPPSILEDIKQYNFPGNIRELKNILERFQVYTNGEVFSKETYRYLIHQSIDPSLISNIEHNEYFEKNNGTLDVKKSERQLIERALDKNQGNKEKAAKELGISRTTLWRKLK